MTYYQSIFNLIIFNTIVTFFLSHNLIYVMMMTIYYNFDLLSYNFNFIMTHNRIKKINK